MNHLPPQVPNIRSVHLHPQQNLNPPQEILPVSQPSPPTYVPQNVPQMYESTPPVQGISQEVQQPTGVVQDPGTHHEGWNSGLFDCFQNPCNALITLLFPCITFGQIAEILDRGSGSCFGSGMAYFCCVIWFGCPFVISCRYRSLMRSTFVLPDTPCPDFIVHCLCEHCALCQEYRELQHRGLDPSLGWSGNMATAKALAQRDQQATSMMPPTNQRIN